MIRAVSFKERPVGRELSARFNEAGGTIGRGETSTLVLPDPDRFISRTHATVSFQAGGFIITDNSTKNPIGLNGRALGQGSQARLRTGDRIKVGDYTLEVTLVEQPVARTEPLIPPRVPPVADRWPEPLIPPRVPPVADRWPEPPRPVIPGPLPADQLADLRGKEPSVDDLFALKPGESPGLLDAPLGRPEGGGILDPLELLGAPPRPLPSVTVPDHGPEVFTAYVPPVAKAEPKAPPVPPQIPTPPPAVPRIPQAPPPEPAAEGVSTGPVGPAEEELLRAFLRGAGLPELPQLRRLTPETMEAIGQLMREATQGTLDLLRARGLTKSELRADVTVIMPLDNNPLKFSPTVEAALAHLLVPQAPGFMPPLPAMKRAYDDLRAHQLGFLAGMRAALEEVLSRFTPEELEKRLSEPSVLDSLLPMNRKAKLWDLFVERYGDVAGAAREDFNAAFGKAFVRAYEAQVKQLRREERSK
jgi:type VI secretion system FHA domain protein